MTTVVPDAPAPAAATAARLIEVHKRFPLGQVEVTALQGVSLDIKAGEFLVILGPSGSGKTTLLNLLGGLDTPTAGQVVVDGQDLGGLADRELTRYRRERVGFVFQFFNLIPTLTAAENIEFALELVERDAKRVAARTAELLGQVGLAERADHFPSRLSGWRAAARRHCPRARQGPAPALVRRADGQPGFPHRHPGAHAPARGDGGARALLHRSSRTTASSAKWRTGSSGCATG